MFEVGDKVKYHDYGYGTVTQVDVNLVTVTITHDKDNRPEPKLWVRRFKPDGQSAGGYNYPITLVEKAKPMFDFKSMTLPVTLDTDDKNKATITGISPCGKYAYGYTHGKHIVIAARSWDQNGNEIWALNPSSPERSMTTKRNLVQPKSEAQKQYESLDADGRGILVALQNNYTASINYIKDKLKVDVNLAQDILNHATKKDYK